MKIEILDEKFDPWQAIVEYKRNQLQNDLKIGVFPTSEKSWLDVGQWEEYSATIKQLGL